LTGRPEEQIALVEAYAREQGMFHDEKTPEAEYSELLSLDLATVEPSLAGPKRPQDRVSLSQAGASFHQALPSLIKPKTKTSVAVGAPTNPINEARWESEGGNPVAIGVEDPGVEEHVPKEVKRALQHGSVVIAAITSCTNTSNPSVLMAAGLLAKRAVERGLETPPWVKTSLAPGSKVVTDYLAKAGLLPYLEKLKFNLVGYGCTTCIGNSGPLPAEVSRAIDEKDLVVVSVLSGNRNFEGRINSEVRANYLMSPPLVVAFALAGRIDLDMKKDPIGRGRDGQPVHLADLWPTEREVDEAVRQIAADMFQKSYAEIYEGDSRWRSLPVPEGETYAWDKDSTYIRKAPYFDAMSLTPPPIEEILGARVLAVLGDSVTTDHISPAGSIKKDSPAGSYLTERGVKAADFNSYGSRRGNHEVMLRGTFANVRLRNKMVPGLEGGFTRHLPDGKEITIFEASEKYMAEGVPLVIVAGREYGSGSSRDWAAKGPKLLGVKAVIAESYERIHRSNLVGMGILPLQFLPGTSAESLKLTGEEVFEITGIRAAMEKFTPGRELEVRAVRDGKTTRFPVVVRVDTPQEALYYANGGILQFVLRQLLANKPEPVHA
jgi:aconitate hydratase